MKRVAFGSLGAIAVLLGVLIGMAVRYSVRQGVGRVTYVTVGVHQHERSIKIMHAEYERCGRRGLEDLTSFGRFDPGASKILLTEHILESSNWTHSGVPGTIRRRCEIC